MTSNKFDETMENAIDWVKNYLPNESILTLHDLFPALLSQAPYSERYPELISVFLPQSAQEKKADRIKLDESVRSVFNQVKKSPGGITADQVFELALFHDELGKFLAPQGQLVLAAVRDRFRLERYQASQERQTFLKNLSRFGSFLTDEELTEKDLCGREDLIPSICRSLMKLRVNDALLVGPSGIGKTAIIREFARRVKENHESIPPALRGAEVFQISPENLTVGTISRPQFTDRIKRLREHIEKHPKMILVINPMDALVSKDYRRPDSVVTEEIIRHLVESQVPILATMSHGSYLLIDSKPEWENLFEVHRIEEPPTNRLIQVLKSQVPSFQKHYVGLSFTDDGLQTVIDYAKRTHPTVCEPRRSVQFLDELCVRAQTSSPIITELNRITVEDILASPLSTTQAKININSEELMRALSSRIVGQDAILQRLSETITTRMSKWASSERPRGVFLFGGPTGVGKTETAVQLAQIISGSANNLIRVDCNTLQPTGHQKTSVIWTLLGVPPGYMGHGEGGILSKVREKPNAVILFDEFEKADAAVGKLLLQILDTGVQRDNNGTFLDFRQSLIIFTSNLGCDYNESPASLGFSTKKEVGKKVPTVDEEQLRSELKLMGYGPEFLARIHNIFLFLALKDNDIAKVIENLVTSLQPFIEDQGYQLTTAATFYTDVAEAYDPRDGVRGVLNKVRSNFTRSISEAERRGDLKGIQTICLYFGEESLKRDGDALHMYIAI